MSIKVFKKLKDFYQWTKTKPSGLGLVPTMGNLHNAHLSLVKKSLEENSVTIVTIFVNPKQFGENEDFASYPRTLQEDLKKLKSLHAATDSLIVFAPDNPTEIYPPQFSTTISVGKLGQDLEGQFRPTHFDGVTTVVYRLFTLFNPQRAYFGEKDYQQLVIIKKMVKDLNLKVKIVPVEIGREISGLAMSSRNQYLTDEEKKKALKLRKSLLKLSKTLESSGVKQTQIEMQKLKSQDSSFNYIEMRNALSLSKINSKTKSVVILATYQIGKTRLLDNIKVSL